MAQQIVLFKIELCPEVKKIYQNHFICRPYLPDPIEMVEIMGIPADEDDPKFRNESAFETSKADGFADDNSTGTLFEYGSLLALKNILSDFESISGLKCNTEKTALMQIGRIDPVPEDIAGLGFLITDKIHILGMDIDANISDLDGNFDRTVINLKKSVDYWKRYNLTLPGRINVIKSLLFSQILYLGSFLMPSADKLKTMQKTLDDFAIGNMNLARDRVTLPVSMGGLGLFCVEKFLVSQQAKWVFKAYTSSRDNWRYMLRCLSNGNVLSVHPDLIMKNANPVLYGISNSYSQFRTALDTNNSNFLNAFIIGNPLFFRGPRDKHTLNLSYLMLPEAGNCAITKLTAREFFNVNGIKTRLELLIDSGIDIPLEGYVRLARCLNHYANRLRPNARNNGSALCVKTDFLSLKNPGKKIRATLVKKKRKTFKLEDQTGVKKYLEITGGTFPGESPLEKILTLWNCLGLSNRIRTFLFRFFNNTLGINTRLSHFVPGHSRGCTFCRINNVELIPDETFKHIFMDCPTVRAWHTHFLDYYFPANYLRDDQDRTEFFFLGRVHEPYQDNHFIILCIFIFQYTIWEARIKKRIPSFNSLRFSFKELCYLLLRSNSLARKSKTKINYAMFRNLLDDGGQADGPVPGHGPE